MLVKMFFIAVWSIAFSIVAEQSTRAATQFESVTIGYSSFSGAYGPLWLAVEGQLGKKYRVDVKKTLYMK